MARRNLLTVVTGAGAAVTPGRGGGGGGRGGFPPGGGVRHPGGNGGGGGEGGGGPGVPGGPGTPGWPGGGGFCDVPPGASDEAFELALTRKRHIEIYSTGIDEQFQTFGHDPWLGISNFGLRVPFLATSDPAKRYLFNLASFTLADGQIARIVGYRQFWSLGVRIGASGAQPRFVEQPVTQPGFALADGNVSFHLNRIAHNEVPVPNQGPINPPLRDFVFRMSDNPALLYEAADAGGTFYVNLTTYTPPNRGRPWGTILQSNLGTFYDQKTDWLEHGAWHALDIPVDGPCTVGFFASVRQTNPVTRAPLPPPATFFPNGLTNEEQFLLNFPFVTGESTGAIIWRVAGALIVELDA